MTKDEYIDALSELGLEPTDKLTAAALGVSIRQCQRIAIGERGITGTIALLLQMYLKHGLPRRIRYGS